MYNMRQGKNVAAFYIIGKEKKVLHRREREKEGIMRISVEQEECCTGKKGDGIYIGCFFLVVKLVDEESDLLRFHSSTT